MTRGLLAAVFAHVPPSLIQVRVLEDRRGGALVCRAWFPDPGQLDDDLSKSDASAAERTASVFIGVLARQAPGGGTPESALPGLAAWADVDVKVPHGARDPAASWPRLRAGRRLPSDAEALRHALVERPAGEFCHFCHRFPASSRRIPSLGRVGSLVDRGPA